MRSIKFLFILVILIAVVVAIASVLPYRNQSFGLTSELADSLRIFYYNQSHHLGDIAPDCWYDSGDYTMFAQRNTQALYYLSMAYDHASSQGVKDELRATIEGQLNCVDTLFAEGIKQLRDQDTHLGLTPPLINQLLTPNRSYAYEDSEGRDVAALRALIAKNLGDDEGYEAWSDEARSLSTRTQSENCCEEGPIEIDEDEYAAIEHLADLKTTDDLPGSWGISFRSIALLEGGKIKKIASILESVRSRWDGEPGQFDYIGGNYDIAGTIALERWYAKLTGDDQYKGLSDDLYAYLHGENSFGVDFASFQPKHHPCGQWWATCQLPDTLINGVDETLKFDTNRDDIWRLTEVQLTGQSEYILMKVLYEGL